MMGLPQTRFPTTVLLLGITEGLALIESLDNAEAVFITKDNQIYITEGPAAAGDGKTPPRWDGYTIVETLN